MCRYVEIGIVCLGVLAMSEACNETKVNPAPTAEQEQIRFTLDAPQESKSSRASRGSRAMTSAVENEIATVDVLVFDASGLVVWRAATLAEGTTFDVSLPRGTYDLMMVAGAREAVGGLVPRTSRADVIRQMRVARAEKWDYSTPIPMWGHADGVTVEAGLSLRVDVHRMLARVDVRLAAAVTDFEMRTIWLANPNSVGQVVPNYLDAAVWDPSGGVVNPGRGVAVAPSLPSDAGRISGLAQMFDAADGVTAREATRVIYAFEAAAGSDASRAESPCLVIGGAYAGSLATSWYRIDFAVPIGGRLEYFPLLRNHNYIITIQSVSGAGLSTPQAALNASSSGMVVGVQEWQDGGLGPIEL